MSALVIAVLNDGRGPVGSLRVGIESPQAARLATATVATATIAAMRHRPRDSRLLSEQYDDEMIAVDPRNQQSAPSGCARPG
jgi:hypothetical protein